MYVEQRRMQNAADAAVLAAAQNWLSSSSQLNAGPAVVDARNYATFNGYTTSVAAGSGVWDPAANDGVWVSIPPSAGPHAGDSQYVEAIVSKPVRTFFAGIFNVNTVQITARAVARGMAGTIDSTIIALGDDEAAISSSGSSTTNVYGSIYSAGGIKCNNGNIVAYQGAAYAAQGFGDRCQSGQLQTTYGRYSNAPRLYDPRWPSFESQAPLGPGGNWSSVGKTPGADGYIHLPAGTYNSITVNSGDNVMFDGGVYHLIGEGDSPALTIQGHVETAAPLQFVLETGATHFEAQATGTLSSGPQYNNILIYSKRSDGGNAIQITGGANMTYDGTIYAPGANVLIAGNASANVYGQLVAKTITLSGSSGTAVQWDGSKAPVIIAPRLAE